MKFRTGLLATALLPLAGSLLLAGSLSAAQMYRWVDKDGKVHFSDQPPPPDAKQSQQMAAPTSEPFKETTTETASERAARLRQAADGISADRQARAENKAEIAANKAKQAQACAAAKDQLNRWDTANLKYLVDENNQRQEMSDEQYAEAEKQLRAAVENACR